MLVVKNMLVKYISIIKVYFLHFNAQKWTWTSQQCFEVGSK